MTRRFTLALIAALGIAAIPHVSMAANSSPAIDAFNDAFAKVSQFTYKFHSHEVLGNQTQTRVYDYSFMKPHFAKTLIESGDQKGAGGVWTGGNQVSGHQGGFLSGIHLKVSINDPRATSLRGYTIPDGLPQNVVSVYVTTPGTLTTTPGGKIDGADTDLLDLKLADPKANSGVTELKCYMSRATHFPVRQIEYTGDQVVLDQTFTDYNFNPGLTQNDFPF